MTRWHLVKSFGAQSVSHHAFPIPVIHCSTDSNNQASAYLLEDGLELWNTNPSPSCDLLNERNKIDVLLRLMLSVGHMFETPLNSIQLQLFEPFILKAMNLALNPEVYPMIMAM